MLADEISRAGRANLASPCRFAKYFSCYRNSTEGRGSMSTETKTADELRGRPV